MTRPSSTLSSRLWDNSKLSSLNIQSIHRTVSLVCWQWPGPPPLLAAEQCFSWCSLPEGDKAAWQDSQLIAGSREVLQLTQLTWGRQSCLAGLAADCWQQRSASADSAWLRETKLPGRTRSWLLAAEKCFNRLSLPRAGGRRVSSLRSRFKLTSPCKQSYFFVLLEMNNPTIIGGKIKRCGQGGILHHFGRSQMFSTEPDSGSSLYFEFNQEDKFWFIMIQIFRHRIRNRYRVPYRLWQGEWFSVVDPDPKWIHTRENRINKRQKFNIQRPDWHTF